MTPTASEQTAKAQAVAEHALAGDLLTKLREPFPASKVGQLPRAGISLDYVGHGAVTERLLEVDPFWTWEPMGVDEHGAPLIVEGDGFYALWIRLTVCGVTRPGVGTQAPPNQNMRAELFKMLVSDALRNAAMRFGVALDLWIKGHAEDDERAGERAAPARRGGPPECVNCGKQITGNAVPHPDGGFAHKEDCSPDPTAPGPGQRTLDGGEVG